VVAVFVDGAAQLLGCDEQCGVRLEFRLGNEPDVCSEMIDHMLVHSAERIVCRERDDAHLGDTDGAPQRLLASVGHARAQDVGDLLLVCFRPICRVAPMRRRGQYNCRRFVAIFLSIFIFGRCLTFLSAAFLSHLLRKFLSSLFCS
jgi:hypothetical protein